MFYMSRLHAIFSFLWILCTYGSSKAFCVNHQLSIRLIGTTTTSTTTTYALLNTSIQSNVKPDIEDLPSSNNDKVPDPRLRFRGRVAYDGSSFKGWQVQANGRTVQGEIEKILSRRFNRTMKIVGAGRTDSGVHARGQAFHFDLYPEEIHVKESQKVSPTSLHHDVAIHASVTEQFCNILQTSLNSMLPEDIRVWNIAQCPPPISFTKTLSDGSESTRVHKWHVIYNSKQKLYVYRISMGPHAISTDPLERYSRVHVEGNIHVDHLQRILKHYEGTHDFRAFAGAIEANQRKDGIEHKDTVRTVYDVALIDEGDGKYRIEILLKGALYKMVRNMVGTALDVCKGRVDEDYFLQMLHHSSEDGTKQFVRKDNKCKPAPPEGLELARVDFDDDW